MNESNTVQRGVSMPIVIGIIVLALVVIAAFIFIPQSSPEESVDEKNREKEVSQEKEDTILNEKSVDLLIGTIEEGAGAQAETGDVITVHYTGVLEDGTKFDSSYDRGEPITIQIGAGQVIQGWELGIPGMRIGEKRKLTIPSELAYGAQGRPGIPPNATLIFEVELVSIEGK